MKKLIVTIVFISAGFALKAQDDIISRYFQHYYNDDKATKVSVSSKMFQLFTEIEPGDADEKEILDAISKLKSFKAVGFDSVANPMKYYHDAIGKIQKAGFEELMSVQKPDQAVNFQIHEKGDQINELAMVVSEKHRFMIISLYGDIDLKNISKLARSLNITGMKYLKDYHPEHRKNHDNDQHEKDKQNDDKKDK